MKITYKIGDNKTVTYDDETRDYSGRDTNIQGRAKDSMHVWKASLIDPQAALNHDNGCSCIDGSTHSRYFYRAL